jgi:TPR repeat protein
VPRLSICAAAVTAALAVLIGTTVWPHRTRPPVQDAAGRRVGVEPTALERDVRRVHARAEAGDADAQAALGNAYEAADGVPRDPVRAARWYRRAASRGHVDAQVSLALLLLDGRDGPRDVAGAAAWLQRAAERGSAFAQHALGEILEAGRDGVRAQPDAAAHWYRRAAEHGYGPAQVSLGRCYEEGRALPRDLREAAAWYRRAADQDLVDAQIRLGALYRRAELGPDLVEAHVWLNLAASRFKSTDQFVTASRMRDEVARSLSEAQLLEAFRRATAWQDTTGMAGR